MASRKEEQKAIAIDIDQFRVPEDVAAGLDSRPSRVEPVYGSKQEYESMLADGVERLRARQRLLYADDRYALLVVLQGMDTAGKDGAISHVMSGVNPQGCEVHSFKQPSQEELQHDFLWRSTVRLPARGRIGIFNRSYYEDVLITRVHPNLLADGQPVGRDWERFWAGRYESIRDFERHLGRNGTKVVKIFLHLSRQEQKQRFLARIDDPDKNWKFQASDIAERKFWDDYLVAYEECLTATSTTDAPWYAVPADDKENARLIVSEVILGALSSLDLRYPRSGPERATELQEIRRELEAEA